MILKKSKGTSAYPTGVTLNDYLGTYEFAGHDGASWGRVAFIAAQIDAPAVNSETSTYNSICGFTAASTTTAVSVSTEYGGNVQVDKGFEIICVGL